MMGELKSKLASANKVKAEVKEKQSKILFESIQEIANTEAGTVVLKHLRKFCGFGESNTVANIQTGEINIQGTLHNNQFEEVYKNLRTYMSKKTKIKVELND